VANSISELAQKAGIDEKGLARQVEEYNEFCSCGFDPVFNKNHRYLRPIKKPPFYGTKLMPAAYGSLGGIKINYKMEVIVEDYNPLRGLYAAGTDANSINGDSYVFIFAW